MKLVQHKYDPSRRIIDMVADAMEGTIEGNFITGDTPLYKGTHYGMEGDVNLAALMTDTYYKEEALISYESPDIGFVNITFMITDQTIEFTVNKQPRSLSKWSNDICINDVVLPNDYLVRKNSNVFTIGIFIEKETLKEALESKGMLSSHSEDVFDDTKNTIIRLDRMSFECLNLINDFRKISYDNPFFEIYFRSMVHALLYKYLDDISTEKMVISKVTFDDFKNILTAKNSLLNSIEGRFPGIDFLASEVAMSASKFKNLFVKITGATPANFFNQNKLLRAKELLESQNLTIYEIVSQLNYCSTSYFAKCFKEMYGLFPKEYQKQL
ncbi:AraC family transcriptional regulator [Flavobacterium sp. NKUCC04_CG]|uniref:helix-turn-helix domain-containing protein n=1 Tax=Flavobacterium sp. NKUCC04_CG TaxID=2842121 RepID=UPI001C5AB293|nr:AraC family transcriptional regulator [Flavobacterium sp. NKUCC04_CG]MBW3519206.1 AraC family transcriptional regulator [Flavobacterium sp. NKUCC04_CG]